MFLESYNNFKKRLLTESQDGDYTKKIHQFAVYVDKNYGRGKTNSSKFFDVDVSLPQNAELNVYEEDYDSSDVSRTLIRSLPITKDIDEEGNVILRVGSGRRSKFVKFYSDGSIMKDQLGWLEDLVK